MKGSRFHTMLWAGERAALRSWAFSVLMEEAYSKENWKGLQKRAREWWATLVYMLLVSRQVPVSQQYWRKRIGPSLADRSRVELALLPRLSLTRLSRTQSLFEFEGSFVIHSLASTCVVVSLVSIQHKSQMINHLFPGEIKEFLKNLTRS